MRLTQGERVVCSQVVVSARTAALVRPVSAARYVLTFNVVVVASPGAHLRPQRTDTVADDNPRRSGCDSAAVRAVAQCSHVGSSVGETPNRQTVSSRR